MLKATNAMFGTGMHKVLVQPAVPVAADEGGKPAPSGGNVLPGKPEQADLAVVVEKLNLATKSIGRELHFEVNLDSGHTVIRVLERETGEVIREIPPEKVVPILEDGGALLARLYEDVV